MASNTYPIVGVQGGSSPQRGAVSAQRLFHSAKRWDFEEKV
jgi:hypothetical protein